MARSEASRAPSSFRSCGGFRFGGFRFGGGDGDRRVDVGGSGGVVVVDRGGVDVDVGVGVGVDRGRRRMQDGVCGSGVMGCPQL